MQAGWLAWFLGFISEGFTLRTRTTTSTRSNLRCFRVLSKNIQPEKLHCSFFHRKICAVIFIGELLAKGLNQGPR